EILDPARRLQVEVEPVVHAALAEVAEQDRVVPVLGHQRAVVTDVAAQPLRWDGGVLPAREAGMLARDPGVLDRAAPDLPDFFLALRVLEQLGAARARVPARRLY